MCVNEKLYWKTTEQLKQICIIQRPVGTLFLLCNREFLSYYLHCIMLNQGTELSFRDGGVRDRGCYIESRVYFHFMVARKFGRQL